ncbi:MAG: flavin reductase family protein [Promethearchaeota archaeon]
MMEDVKKYQKAEKRKKKREEIQEIPYYYDGLENLCNRIHPTKQILRISDIKQLSHDTKLFRFVSAIPQKPLAPFRAGQYVGITVEINGVRTSRPYSLVSSPNQLVYYELGIRKKVGGFVSPYIFENAKVGDIIEATEPMGNLFYNSLFHGNNLVFIAGGCGITPFISLLRDLTEKMIPLNIWLIYGALKESEILFKDELEDIQSRRKNVNIKYVLSEPDSSWSGACGFITRDIISSEINSLNQKYYYTVGNRAMYNFIQGELNALGIPKHRTYFEAYGVPDDITQVMGWPENISKSQTVEITLKYRKQGKEEEIVFKALSTEPLLNSIEKNGNPNIIIENSCRSGECALCRTKKISGKVFVPPEVTIRDIDKDIGYIHPCVSYPLTDLHLDLTLT